MSWRVVAWTARVLSAVALVAGVVLLVENLSGRWVSLCVAVTLVLGWASMYAAGRIASSQPHENSIVGDA